MKRWRREVCSDLSNRKQQLRETGDLPVQYPDFGSFRVGKPEECFRIRSASEKRFSKEKERWRRSRTIAMRDQRHQETAAFCRRWTVPREDMEIVIDRRTQKGTKV